MSAQSLNKLKELLLSEGYTCVLEKDGKIFTSRERGIRPLIAWLDSGEDFRGGTAADKVVGKAAAFLYVRLGIRKLYAEVLAESGLSVVRTHAIEAENGTLSRVGNCFCGKNLCLVWRVRELVRFYGRTFPAFS